jgi:hypothetical protein
LFIVFDRFFKLNQITCKVSGHEISYFNLLDEVVSVFDTLSHKVSTSDFELLVLAKRSALLEESNLNHSFVHAVETSAVAIHKPVSELSLLDELNGTVKWVVDITKTSESHDSADTVEVLFDLIKVDLLLMLLRSLLLLSFLLVVLLVSDGVSSNRLVSLDVQLLQILHVLNGWDHDVDVLVQVSFVAVLLVRLSAHLHVVQDVVTTSVQVLDVSCLNFALEVVLLVSLLVLLL